MASRRIAFPVLGWLLFPLTPPALPAQEPTLIADLATGTLPSGSGSESWIRAGDRLYFLRFRATDARAATRELWSTDGTAAGTKIVRELAVPTASTELRGAALADGRLLFVADDAAQGEELWITDGTPEGTKLHADLCPGPCDGSPAPRSFFEGGHTGFVRRGAEVLFAATGPEGVRLFAVSDGGAAPRLVSDLPIADFAVAGDDLLLLTQGAPSGEPLRLWRSTGTPGSEMPVEQLEDGFRYSLGAFRGGALLVATDDVSVGPLRLYLLSTAGADLLAEITYDEFRETAIGVNLAYVLFVDEDRRCSLLRTDGTAIGTFELSAVGDASLENACRGPVATSGDRLFFVHETVAGREPWTSDGTQLGTMLLRDVHPSGDGDPSRFTPVGPVTLFVANDAGGAGLWRSDGTLMGTTQVRSFAGIDHSPHPLGVLDSIVLFAAADGSTGLEPWRSDGTPAGTELVANLTGDEASSNPQRYLRRELDLLFETRFELLPFEPGPVDWSRYDGISAPEGFFTGEAGRVTTPLGVAGDRLLVAVSDSLQLETSVSSIDPDTGEEEILPVAGELVGSIARAGSRALIEMRDRIGSGITLFDGLWSTDGTPAGTTLLLEPLPSTSLGFVAPFEDEDVVWLSYFEPSSGHELWRTDGTPAGTRLALDLVPGPESSLPRVVAASGRRLFLVTFPDDEPTLVVTDRTPHVLHVLPLDAFGDPDAIFTGLRGRLLFTEPADPNESSPVLLRITDGTVEGTRTLASFTSVHTTSTEPFVLSRGLAYFRAGTLEHGLELWATDGTPEGTRLVADLAPGPESSEPTELRDVDGVLLFSARTPLAGSEPWVTDGTPAGTFALGEVDPGPAGSQPRGFVAVDDEVVLTAERPDVGREPFAVDRDSLRRACEPGEHTLCLGEGRFSVEVEWLDRPSGQRGRGHAVPFRADTGRFWFFDPENVELFVKVLDGTSLNDHHWVFYGALSDLQYWVTVVDTWTGRTRSYTNEQGNICGINDTSALLDEERLPSEPRALLMPAAASAPAASSDRRAGRAACEPGTQLCLQGGRFAVDVEWRTPLGESGSGVPIPLTDDTGAFWFFDPDNVELGIKVLDARTVNDRFWVYFGALSDVAYTVRVTDTVTGAVRTYENPQGTICGQADVDAFVP